MEALIGNPIIGTNLNRLRYDLPPWCPKDSVPKVFKALVAINRDIEAIGKNRRNQDQKYSFRGIDDIFNTLHELFAKHGVTSRPVVLQRQQGDRTTKSGSSMIHVALEVEFWLTDEDGATAIIGPTWGEALDTSDKSTNKAISFAMKYAMLQTFTIPTEDMAEGDRTTPEAGAPSVPDEPIGEEMAGRIYSAFVALGVPKDMLLKTLNTDNIAGLTQRIVPKLLGWRDEIAKDKSAIKRIFGGT